MQEQKVRLAQYYRIDNQTGCACSMATSSRNRMGGECECMCQCEKSARLQAASVAAGEVLRISEFESTTRRACRTATSSRNCSVHERGVGVSIHECMCPCRSRRRGWRNDIHLITRQDADAVWPLPPATAWVGSANACVNAQVHVHGSMHRCMCQCTRRRQN